jgi:hypothetical protein
MTPQSNEASGSGDFARKRSVFRRDFLKAAGAVACLGRSYAGDEATRVYRNTLTPIASPQPILEEFPNYVEPIRCETRFEAPPLIDEPGADLDVRAWRWSYNARGIIEIPNRLRSDRTATIVVHPWAIDDGQGWKSPEPAGVAFQCTPRKNALVLEHAREVIDPLLRRLRGQVRLVAYSLPGKEDPLRKKIYRSFASHPTKKDRREGIEELQAKLKRFEYKGNSLPESIALDPENPVKSYFEAFPGLDAGPKYDPAGFWELPIPVMSSIQVGESDLVIYDGEGYPSLRDHLKALGIRHVILAGYNTDMCVCKTTAGWENLRRDFNVFLVGDATIATFPAQDSPRHATNAAVSFAALDLLITQCSWIKAVSR